MNIRTPTETEIRAFYEHPEFAHVKQDGGIQAIEGDFLLFEEGRPVCLANFIPRSSVCLEAHPFMFKEFRLKYARLCVGASYSWVLDGQFEKLVVEIPKNMPRLVNFAKRFGFIEEGINRKSVKQGGKLLDRICLGITAPEMQDYLHINYEEVVNG